MRRASPTVFPIRGGTSGSVLLGGDVSADRAVDAIVVVLGVGVVCMELQEVSPASSAIATTVVVILAARKFFS